MRASTGMDRVAGLCHVRGSAAAAAKGGTRGRLQGRGELRDQPRTVRGRERVWGRGELRERRPRSADEIGVEGRGELRDEPRTVRGRERGGGAGHCVSTPHGARPDGSGVRGTARNPLQATAPHPPGVKNQRGGPCNPKPPAHQWTTVDPTTRQIRGTDRHGVQSRSPAPESDPLPPRKRKHNAPASAPHRTAQHHPAPAEPCPHARAPVRVGRGGRCAVVCRRRR